MSSSAALQNWRTGTLLRALLVSCICGHTPAWHTRTPTVALITICIYIFAGVGSLPPAHRSLFLASILSMMHCIISIVFIPCVSFRPFRSLACTVHCRDPYSSGGAHWPSLEPLETREIAWGVCSSNRNCDGTICDDANPYTYADKCFNGVCRGTPCSEHGPDVTSDSFGQLGTICAADSRWTDPTVCDGTPCSFGKPHLIKGACSYGKCICE